MLLRVTWRKVVAISLLFVLGALNTSHAVEDRSRPNVLFILADDLGWSDTSLYGGTDLYETPNIQRLARRGMTFTRAYSASPLCSPTRSAILTGLSPARTGITSPNCHLPQVVLNATVGKTAAPDQKSVQPTTVTRLNTTYRTLAQSMKDAGYATGHFGKWHLGTEPYSALQHGFDVDLPHHHGPGPAGSYLAPWKFKDFDALTPSEHIEDRMASEAVKWMKQHKDEPFFLNYWMFSVHAPFDAKPELIEKYRPRIKAENRQRSPTYAAMIESMDDAVGSLLDALDELGLAEKTIVIFTSDNGGNMYSDLDGTVPTNNYPLRGGKASMFEGGTRVPCVIAWPGVTKPGSQSQVHIQSEDYYPTLLAGLGLKTPAQQPFDGQSILPALRSEPLEREAIFQFFPHSPPVPEWLPPSVSVHSGDWKLIQIFHGGENQSHRYLLFNLKNDIAEQHDLASQNVEKVSQLRAMLDRFLRDTAAVVPVANTAFDATKYRPSEEGKGKPRQTNANPKQAASQTPRDAADNPQMAGWKTRNCVADVSNGIARIKPTGNSPFLGFPARKLHAGAKLRFRMKSDGEIGKVAWIQGANAATPDATKASVPKPIEYTLKPGQWTEVSVEIPALAEQAGILRLFLPMQDTVIELDWIELAQENNSKRWDF